jgi:hypothetical protein
MTKQTFTFPFKISGTFPIHHRTSYSKDYTAYTLSKICFIEKRVYISLERCLAISQVVALIDNLFFIEKKQTDISAPYVPQNYSLWVFTQVKWWFHYY